MAQRIESVKEQIEAVVEQAKNDPVWFAEEILNIKTTENDAKRGLNWALDLWQKELLEAVADVDRYKNGLPTKFNHEGKNKITIRAMHGPGKTFGVALVMHFFNFIYYGTIVCTAPKEKQLKTRLWPAFRKIRTRAKKGYQDLIKIESTKITWCGDEDWVAHAETASEPENLAGYHADHLLFVVDEASGVKEEMYPVIEGAVSTGHIVVILMIGNPTKNIGTFHDSHRKENVSKNYYQIHVSLDKTSRVSMKWVKEMEDKYGPKSPVVLVRCKGEFADISENQLIHLGWIEDARNREFQEDGSISTLRVSVDVGDGGEDDTVITVTRQYQTFKHFIKQLSFNFSELTASVLTAKAAEAAYYEYGGKIENGDDIVVDAIGVGSGAAGMLIKKGLPVIRYKGGEASDNPKEWRNRRVQSYICMRDDFRDGRAIMEDDFTDEWDDFYAQMASIKSKPGIEKVEDLMTKQEMRALVLKSPDKADSPSMSYATQIPDIIPGGYEDEVTVFNSSMATGVPM